MTRWLRLILFGAILVAGIGYLLYARWFRPIPVSGFEVNDGTLVVEMMGTGTVEARTSTVVSAKIHGRLLELDADQGDHVDSGQIVARLDDSDLARQVEIAQANVEAAEAGLDRLRADRTRAEAVLRRARREDERIRAAFDQGAATDTEIDKSAEQVAVAQADSARAEAAIAEGQKLLIAARQTLGYQQARLDDTVIRAPFHGLIVRRDRDPGDIVVPGSSIYRLIALEEIWVSAWVDETAMASLAPDQPTRVVLRSEPDHPYPGHVVRLGRETDPETREFIVDVAIERLPKQWAIGQRAEAFIETDRLEDVLTMPLTFVAVMEGQRGVFVHRNGRAVWTRCEFGTRGREMIEVRDGLNPGDVLVRLADPAPRVQLSDGRRIVLE
ncbi:MAG: efflux RND transporter periplasmic adaptor subunit [Phycisphaerales bacterium]|nr:efflux RND transporter periplasmic adaptor subunit [Phycisphaerales bacterium]RZV42476.1 MAG: efflux RND transporter periplasmic adaptor subunit [Acidimicrobiales bacterium]